MILVSALFSYIYKIDLEENRVVSKEEGLEFARLNSMLFIETSAKTRQGVEKAFEELVLKIMDVPSLLDSNSIGSRGNIDVHESTGDQNEDFCAC